MQILVVEDDEHLRNVMCELLIEAGHPSVGAGTATEALGRLNDDELDCLIIMDLHLPDMSGEQLIDRIRANPKHASHPIVVMTGQSRSSPVEGSDAMLVKPFAVERLLELIDLHGRA